MSSVAIITARGGSKRIPRKNVREFMGRPMIAYAIDAALGADVFDEVMVSTDDAEIAELSERCGASVPFMRSAAASSDSAATRDVIAEVVCEYGKRGMHFEKLACVYPCVPFLTGEMLAEAWRRFEASGADFLMPVVRYSFPVQRALRVNADGFLEYREPQLALMRSQDLEPTFHDVGMFYLTKTDAYLAGESFRRSYYEVPAERVQDIDTLQDWKMAEMKYRMLHDVQDRT